MSPNLPQQAGRPVKYAVDVGIFAVFYQESGWWRGAVLLREVDHSLLDFRRSMLTSKNAVMVGLLEDLLLRRVGDEAERSTTSR